MKIKKHNQMINVLVKFIEKTNNFTTIEFVSIDLKSIKKIDIDTRMKSFHLHINIKVLNLIIYSYISFKIEIIKTINKEKK